MSQSTLRTLGLSLAIWAGLALAGRSLSRPRRRWWRRRWRGRGWLDRQRPRHRQRRPWLQLRTRREQRKRRARQGRPGQRRAKQRRHPAGSACGGKLA